MYVKGNSFCEAPFTDRGGSSTIPAVSNMTGLFSYNLNGVGEAAVNVLNFVDIGGDNDEPTATGIAEAWEAVYPDIAGTDALFEGATRFIFPAEDPTDEVFATNSGVQGAASAGIAPVQCAARYDLSAGLGARRRGHIYLPGLAEGEVEDAGLISTAHANGMLDLLGDFITDAATNWGFLLGVHSRVDGVVRGVTGISLQPYVRTQRRRMDAIAGG